jgi:hypothetical protein
MYEELRSTDNKKTVITFILTGVMLCVLIGVKMFPKLQGIFDVLNNEIHFFRRFGFIFYQGFSQIAYTEWLHFFINVYFLFVLGSYLEKVLGSWRYLLLIGCTIIVYGSITYYFELFSPGTTGVLWAFVPVVFYSLLEARRIKTRSMFEDYYKFLRLNAALIAIILPIFMIFLQFYLRGEISYSQAIYHGLVPFLSCLAVGVVFTYFNRAHLKNRLKSFNYRKKLKYTNNDKLAPYVALLIPAYIFIILVYDKF